MRRRGEMRYKEVAWRLAFDATDVLAMNVHELHARSCTAITVCGGRVIRFVAKATAVGIYSLQ
jgi:hypothetical protein